MQKQGDEEEVGVGVRVGGGRFNNMSGLFFFFLYFLCQLFYLSLSFVLLLFVGLAGYPVFSYDSV